MSTLRLNIDCAVENGTPSAQFFAAEIGSGKATVVPSLFLLVAAWSAAAAFRSRGSRRCDSRCRRGLRRGFVLNCSRAAIVWGFWSLLGMRS